MKKRERFYRFYTKFRKIFEKKHTLAKPDRNGAKSRRFNRIAGIRQADERVLPGTPCRQRSGAVGEAHTGYVERGKREVRAEERGS